MTNAKAIEVIRENCYVFNPMNLDRTTLVNTALDTAIKALEAPPNDNWEGYSSRLWKAAYERGKAEQTSVLGKIKAKLIEEKECAYADFERYKVEYLGQDWSDVYDSLPQDDFRYGMERCIDIINKYMAESEEV